MGNIFSRLKKGSTFPVYDLEMSPRAITRALEYVSRELRRHRQHIHLVVSGLEALGCLLFNTRRTCRTMNVLIATRMTPKDLSALARAVQKATKRFSLGENWLALTPPPLPSPKHTEDLVYRSLLQNDILFTSEGLTLVAVDHTFALKTSLLSPRHQHTSLSEPLAILRRMVYLSRGRPLNRGYIRSCYPHLEISDSMLLRLNAEYEAFFVGAGRGIVGVCDEYIGWRREGLSWSNQMEGEYSSESNWISRHDDRDADNLGVELEKPVYDWDTQCNEDIMRIFSSDKGLYD